LARKPLISHEAIVNLIAATTTRKGLKIDAEIDRNVYPKGIHVSEEELEKLQSKERLSGRMQLHDILFSLKLYNLFLGSD